MAEKSNEELLDAALSDHEHAEWLADGENNPKREGIEEAREAASKSRAAVLARMAEPAPVPMILHCPSCGTQHVDEPDERTPGWTNPPHRSHLCHSCGTIWRPSDVATVGVRAIETKGKADTWDGTAPAARMCGPGEVVVPKEPTEEMEEAGWIDKEDVCPCDIYRAMLAARPNNGGTDDQGK